MRLSMALAAGCAATILSGEAFAQGAGAPESLGPRTPGDFLGVTWSGGPPIVLPPTDPPRTTQAQRTAVAQANLDYPEGLVPLLQPWVVETRRRYHDASLTFNPNATGDEPLTSNMTCHPFGIPGEPIAVRSGLQFLSDGKVVVMAQAQHMHWRTIYMNEEHPTDLKPSWLGHSVGRWEGDTLVVDTKGYGEYSSLSSGNSFHSTQMHTIERFRMVRMGLALVLEAKITYEDPGAFTKPFELTRILYPAVSQEMPMEERVCQENTDQPVPVSNRALEPMG